MFILESAQLDNSFVKNQLELFKDVLKAEDFMADELHITEWNFTISNRNCINDSCAQGAYIMKTLYGINRRSGYDGLLAWLRSSYRIL